MQHLLFEMVKSNTDSYTPYLDGLKDVVTWASRGVTNTEFVKDVRK